MLSEFKAQSGGQCADCVGINDDPFNTALRIGVPDVMSFGIEIDVVVLESDNDEVGHRIFGSDARDPPIVSCRLLEEPKWANAGDSLDSVAISAVA